MHPPPAGFLLPERGRTVTTDKLDQIATRAGWATIPGAISFPAWWPTLESASTFASQLVPIVGLLIAVVNLALLIRKWRRGRGRAFCADESGAVGRRTVAGLGAVLALAAAVITPFEGRELRAYRDIVGVWTICDGDTQGVRPGQVATPAECDSRLATRVAQFEREIRPCLPAELPDPTRAAFISAAYNIGSGAFCGSSMARRARAGDLRGACDALRLWNRAGGQVVRGLVRRREAERDLCLSGL
ncbi:lysozyme [Sinirhodobacter hankyongi]|uniref:Lysozyme n=1 Tax=Paenirhodobacter hankyongi TaxID=2294033 RepID=A0A421BK13_9RHOB|nr:lysozyme [Sinirhodobacter hankyongi]